MTKTAEKPTLHRRRFIRVFGFAAAGAATVPAIVIAKAEGETTTEKRKSRYRESEHIKTFYRVNRYPS